MYSLRVCHDFHHVNYVFSLHRETKEDGYRKEKEKQGIDNLSRCAIDAHLNYLQCLETCLLMNPTDILENYTQDL